MKDIPDTFAVPCRKKLKLDHTPYLYLVHYELFISLVPILYRNKDLEGNDLGALMDLQFIDMSALQAL